MSKDQKLVFIVATIGAISALVSSVGIIRGAAFSDQYLGLFCGITLLGAALNHHLDLRR